MAGGLDGGKLEARGVSRLFGNVEDNGGDDSKKGKPENKSKCDDHLGTDYTLENDTVRTHDFDKDNEHINSSHESPGVSWNDLILSGNPLNDGFDHKMHTSLDENSKDWRTVASESENPCPDSMRTFHANG
ncbi:unnamed protein product [Bursaphelenchus xylophilus]|uniref:(pine wood nematode) hypothetical protein n=1 Tax=Bursaphelenchus xylophilus TaxID=6326 RepID=A0A7I8XLT3_BURXY|nr:unnamed protein product [Bursaphelenchus xylophilus]CAG9089889.1 unnamed protein product [Bursaphelenchus xylophilus]